LWKSSILIDFHISPRGSSLRIAPSTMHDHVTPAGQR
jgi:hypothetical protein